MNCKDCKYWQRNQPENYTGAEEVNHSCLSDEVKMEQNIIKESFGVK